MVVFDMAGTTVDEDNLVYKTVLTAIRRAGYETDLATVLTHGAGKEKLRAIQDTLRVITAGPEAKAAAPAIHADFRELLTDAYARAGVRPQAGAERVFRALRERGICVVLNTGYDRATADTLLRKLGWAPTDLIDLVVTAGDVETGRPGPEMIHYAMRRMDIADAGRVVKIGDSVIDIEEGRNANCGLVVGITTGAHTEEQLRQAAPDAIVDSLEALLSMW